MQKLILEVSVKLTNFEEESWTVYNEAESNKRDVAEDQGKQGKNEERSSTEHSDRGDDRWDLVADKRIRGRKKVVLKRMEWEDS